MFASMNWTLYLTLVGLGVAASIAILPYAKAMNPESFERSPLPLPVLLLLTVLQGAVMMAVLVGLGLLAADAVGLSVPVFTALLAGEPWLPLLAPMLLPALIGGTLSALTIIGLEAYIFGPRLPEALRQMTGRIAVWKRFLASFYGGIAEELMLRLFMVSALAWLLGLVWHTPAGLPAAGAFVTAILLAAVLFGLGHLPATGRLTPLTSLVITRALVLNGLAGIVFGLLYWRYGLEAAMLAHFTGDIFLHVLNGLNWGRKPEKQPLDTLDVAQETMNG